MPVLSCYLASMVWMGACRIHSDLGGRELRPPREGIEVGSLYFVRETPSEKLSEPANLAALCTTELNRWDAKVQSARSADVDLSHLIEAQGGLEGLETKFVELGIKGKWTDYFSYHLTNVVYSSIDLATADRIFEGRGQEPDCKRVRVNVAKQNWAIYQIQAIYSGDLALTMRDNVTVDVDLAAKLKLVEPTLRTAARKSIGSSYSGKGMVVAFMPISRD